MLGAEKRIEIARDRVSYFEWSMRTRTQVLVNGSYWYVRRVMNTTSECYVELSRRVS